MTLEEGLQGLKERHEALTQCVELLLQESQEHTRQLLIDAENIRALARIAECHDRRITDLENGRS